MRICRCSSIQLLQMIIYLKLSLPINFTQHVTDTIWSPQYLGCSVLYLHIHIHLKFLSIMNMRNVITTYAIYLTIQTINHNKIYISFFYFFTYHNRTSLIKILSASQAPYINRYKNTTGKIINCNGNIYFNQECIKRNITSQYAKIKSPFIPLWP